MEFKIEKNIPLAKSYHPSKYPWGEMGVGDSIFFSCSEEERIKIRNKIGSASHAWGESRGMKFATRFLSGGVRIWRVK